MMDLLNSLKPIFMHIKIVLTQFNQTLRPQELYQDIYRNLKNKDGEPIGIIR